MTHSYLLAFVALGSACTDKYLPTPETPARVLPALPVEPGPAAEGQGRIALDVVDGPSTVEEILATESWKGTYVAGSAERTRHLCDTPCVLNLPYGTYNMRFTLKDGSRHSEENVVIGARPSVYRYATGSNNMPMGKVWGVVGLIVAGVAAGGISIGELAVGNGGAGKAFMVLGVGLDLGGILLFQTARRWRQHGAAQQWTPETGEVYTLR
jgi:hypothetical protein